MPVDIALLFCLLQLTLKHGQHEASQLAAIVANFGRQTEG